MLVQKSKPNCSHCDTWYQLVTHGTHVTSWYQVSQWTVYSFVTAFHVCDSILVLTRRLNTGYGVVIPGLLNRLRLWRVTTTRSTSVGVLLTNRNPVTNETILDGWAESTSHDTECVTGTPCPTSVKNISFVTEWLRLGRAVCLTLTCNITDRPSRL